MVLNLPFRISFRIFVFKLITMKNTLFIDVDTDRDRTIVFSKPPHLPPPQNAEEAAKLVLTDIACLAEAITTLILMAEKHGYGNKVELVEASVKTINQALENSEDKTDENILNENGPKEETKGSTTQEA